MADAKCPTCHEGDLVMIPQGPEAPHYSCGHDGPEPMAMFMVGKRPLMQDMPKRVLVDIPEGWTVGEFLVEVAKIGPKP